MAVKNITSRIDPAKTIMEIEQILAKFGAKAILKEYDGESVTSMSFYILAPNGEKIPFKLPMKLENARAVIESAVGEGKLPQRFLTEPYRTDQALRVGWRIVKDWIHSQLSLYEMNYADAVEIFLPYAYNSITEQTLYEKIVEEKFEGLALEAK